MKKGFTLIELLAVIVILAIIALIATPVVLSIIEDARVNSNKRSIDFYGKAVGQALAIYQIKNTDKNLVGNYTSSNDGKTLIKNDNNDIVINIDYEGSSVVCENILIQDKLKVSLSNCKVNDKSVDYSYGVESNINSENEETCQVTNHKSFGSTCTYNDLDSSGSITKGDKVTCGTEGFYVIKNPENETVTMLAEWNLNVSELGDIEELDEVPYSYTYCESTIGYQDEHVRGYLDTEINPKLAQYMYSLTAEYQGQTMTAPWPYGTVKFDRVTTGDYGYWAPGGSLNTSTYTDNNGSYPAYVYDNNATLKTYVDSYVGYLNTAISGANASGRLISTSELEVLGCSMSNRTCSASSATAPAWVYQTSYWSGSARSSSAVLHVCSYGRFYDCHFPENYAFGVRPVIEISEDVINAS